MVNKFLHATEDAARLEGMIGICNAKWYSRVWTAMEYIRSAKVRVMDSEKQLHGEDSAQLCQPQLNQFWGEQTAKNGCHELEAQLEIGKNIMPWNLGSLDLCRADSKSRNFGLAFSLVGVAVMSTIFFMPSKVLSLATRLQSYPAATGTKCISI